MKNFNGRQFHTSNDPFFDPGPFCLMILSSSLQKQNHKLVDKHENHELINDYIKIFYIFLVVMQLLMNVFYVILMKEKRIGGRLLIKQQDMDNQLLGV